MKWLPLLSALALALPPIFACGGSVAPGGGTGDAGVDSPSGSGSGGGSGGSSSGGLDSGCPGPPSAPVYSCSPVPSGTPGCGPWGTPGGSPTYPLGCVVTTPQEGTYCGPVTCNCTTEFVDSGATWVCPL